MSVPYRRRPVLRALFVAALGLAPIAIHAQENAPPPGPVSGAIDPQADAALKRMSNDLGSLKSFRVVGDSSLEVVLKSGEKLDFDATSQIALKRPNKLRSDRLGELAHMTAYYDGQNFTLLGRRNNMYAQTPAPGTIDQMIDFARDRLRLDLPAADLLSGDPYKALTEDVTSGRYIGETVVDGVRCDHLSFRGPEVDYQIWIEKGAPLALPRKFVITSKKETGAPEYTVSFRDWQPNANPPDSLFDFTPPAGATKIDFYGLQRGPGLGSTQGEGARP